MFRKVTLILLVLFGFVLSGMAGECFADVSAEIEQAKLNVISLIQGGNYAEAEVQTQKLLADFSEHKGIAEAAWQIAKRYEQSEKYDKAIQLHQYNVEHFPNDIHAMWSQSRVIRLNISSGDDVAADAAFKKLLAVFSDQPTLPKEIWQVAKRYEEFKKHDKAFELYQYNVEHFPKDIHAMWSQMNIIRSYISDANEPAADAAFNKLLTVFSQQPTLPEEIHYVAKKYEEFKKYDKAFELYQYNVEHFPKDIHAMWSQMNIIRSYISDANEPAADAAFKKLLTVFSGQPTLPKEVYLVANAYRNAGRFDKANQLYQYVIKTWSGRGDIDSRRFVAMSHIALGDDDAAAAIDKLLTDFSGHPDLPAAVLGIAEPYWNEALRLEGKGLQSQAKDYFKKALRIAEIAKDKCPNYVESADTLCWTGVCYRALGDYEKSIECYQKVVDDYPSYHMAWNALFMVGRNYESLKESGVISKSEADPKIKAAYVKLLEKYPDSKPSAIAQNWLNKNGDSKEILPLLRSGQKWRQNIQQE